MNNDMFLTKYYSEMLNKKLSTKQTLHLLNTQLAFVMAVFPGCSLIMRMIFLSWLITAVIQCSKALKHSTDTTDARHQLVNFLLRIIESEGSTHSTSNTESIHQRMSTMMTSTHCNAQPV